MIRFDSEDKSKLIEIMRKALKVKKQGFCLSSGIKENYIFIDKIWTDPALLKDLAGILSKVLKEVEFDKLVVLEHIFHEFGVIPIASLVAANISKPLVICKEIGCLNYSIHGDFKKGDKALILYDVTVGGKGLAKIATFIRNNGAEITKIVTIVDREEGASQKLKAEGFTLDFLLTLNEIVSYQQRG